MPGVLASSSTVLASSSTILASSYGDGPVPAPETIDKYLELVTSLHRSRPKFMAMMRLLLEPVVAIQQFIQHLPTDFDLDVAIGVQLDVVGEWVGRSRNVLIPIANVYFSWDDEIRGWDMGVWQGPYDGDFGITRLDDDTYRLVLRAKIAANHWDGTLPGAKAALAIIFPEGDTHVFITDNGDMTVTFGVSGKIPSALWIALLSRNYVPLKPEGVHADYLITSVDNTPLFGFDVDNEYISGWDSGSWGAEPDYFFQP